MSERRKLNRVLFSVALIGLGVLGIVYGDFAMQWQPVPDWLPARPLVAYLSAAVLILGGAGLLSSRMAALSARIFFVYSLLWLALKLPPLATNPRIEANWLGAGELAVIVAASWMLATFNPRQRRVAKYLFAVSLIPIGLSHFFYRPETLSFVPTWLPFRSFWANLGGAGHVAAGVAVLLGIYPRLAATLEAAMIGAFTLLVWLPGVITAPTSRPQWTAFLMSWVIGAAALVVARSLTRRDETIDEGAVKVPANVFASSSTTSRV